MCGIWGIFPKNPIGITKQDLELVPQLMVLTSLRGYDSTGVAVVSDAHQKARTIKQVGGPNYLLNEDAFWKVMEFAAKKGAVMFGHGRSATKGKVLAKNAHPFTYEHITLVHNGTIHFGLTDEMKAVDTEVDSHALCVAIAQKGIVEALKDIMGAYALIVHDSKEGCVYVVRNEERPLAALDLKDKIIIMSEEKAAMYLNDRNYLGADSTKYYPKYQIYKYKIDTQEWSKILELEEYHAKKYTAPPVTRPVGVGVATKTTEGKPRQVNETVKLECVGVEETPKGNLFRYEFVDVAGKSYYGLSSSQQEERVGQSCLTYGFQIYDVVDKFKPEKPFSFVRFRELEWIDPADLKEIEEQKEEQDREVIFLNNKKLKLSYVQKNIMKHDCAICQGPLNLFKAHQTIVTDDDSFICDECVAKGHHYSMGFCQ